GFIDVHTHIEGDEAKRPTADNFIYDGVTTVVAGNCGASNVDIGHYLWWIDSLKLSINVDAPAAAWRGILPRPRAVN
ncbi:MAG TPA: hypothetical protein PK129_12285, partial [Cellvibrionaceae bacterium]|nr:hypothetical protein [Cellvibrionaceae bacterium]